MDAIHFKVAHYRPFGFLGAGFWLFLLTNTERWQTESLWHNLFS
jgi:hypothetical protein